MQTLIDDTHYALRTLLANRLFAVVAILTLALGIGANTAIFSTVNAVLLRPLDVQKPEQVVAIFSRPSGGEPMPNFSMPELRHIRAQTQTVFSGVSGFIYALDGLSVDGRPERMMTSYVTSNFFSDLGLKPALGRLIQPNEGQSYGADPVLVLSHSYWKSKFDGDPGVIGKKVLINGLPVTIVGVAPETFYGFSLFDSVQGYLPMSIFGKHLNVDISDNRGYRLLALRARLRDGVSLEQADAALAVAADRAARENPADSKGIKLFALPEFRARFGTPQITDVMYGTAQLFLALALLVLLLACFNVGNLLLVRATVRQGEMVIRAALGASRLRLFRQFITESAIIGLVGGVAGILLGMFGSAMLGRVSLNSDMPYNFDFGFDWKVFAYGFAGAALSALVVGLVPAYRATRANLTNVLREGGRGVASGKHRLRSALVVAQVGGSLTLLIIAGLFTRSLAEAQRMDLGFDPERVVNLSMDPKQIGYGEEQGRQLFRNLLERVRALPNVESASLAMSVPMGYFSPAEVPVIDGYEVLPGQSVPEVAFNVVSSDYFETMGIRLLKGRVFQASDDRDTRKVAVVNQAMADKFWPGQDPIGKVFRRAVDPKTPIEIVGVVADVRQAAIKPIGPTYYVPLEQRFASFMTLQARIKGDPTAAIPSLRGVVSTLSPDLPVFDVMTMQRGLYTANGFLIFQVGASLASIMGVLGLVLSIVGLYGVIAYSAAQRTREIGIRVAIGARSADVLRLIFIQGATVVGLGVLLGLALAFAATRFIGKFLIVSAVDPLTYIVVSLILVAVALIACYIPARRAAGIDPIIALRAD